MITLHIVIIKKIIKIFSGGYLGKNSPFTTIKITGMKPQNKLWKQIRKLTAGYYTLRFAGLFPIPIYRYWIVRPTNFSALRF